MLILVLYIVALGVNIYLGNSSKYDEYLAYRVLTCFMQTVIVIMLAWALFKIRQNVKKLEAQNILRI